MSVSIADDKGVLLEAMARPLTTPSGRRTARRPTHQHDKICQRVACSLSENRSAHALCATLVTVAWRLRLRPVEKASFERRVRVQTEQHWTADAVSLVLQRELGSAETATHHGRHTWQGKCRNKRTSEKKQLARQLRHSLDSSGTRRVENTARTRRVSCVIDLYC